jgi:hypothetical protein
MQPPFRGINPIFAATEALLDEQFYVEGLIIRRRLIYG